MLDGKTKNASTNSEQVEKTIKAFKSMLLARAFEDKMIALYRAGKISGGVFVGRGQEALSASCGISLKRGDIFAPLIRDAAGKIAFGEPVIDGIRTYLGSRLGPMRGRDGNVHFGRPKEGILAMISHLGAMISAVNGCLMAKRMKGETGFVGLASIGDGGTSTGSFHEAMNQAGVERLPMVVVIANNQYAYSTPNSRQFACKDLVDRAIGYGMQGHTVNGTDLLACLDVVGRAVDLARSGGGPQLVVAKLLRLSGHGEHDDALYVDPNLKKSPIGRDCNVVAEEILINNNWATRDEIEGWKTEFAAQIESLVKQVVQEPQPDSN
ncbi:MAG TPA: thiamine pyrophosphate-dependent dehydrogenase E1 component subunit alpha, partial [Verrucomicrobiota bacterium]|nr:thiamine pyrophosphate-dependent dehydrogenase E1 component subunit alpha [Verrucomicrobiota bacterium]